MNHLAAILAPVIPALVNAGELADVRFLEFFTANTATRTRVGPTPALAAPSVKQRLAAIRHVFAWMVTGQVVPVNPAG
jgi:site-specific recombinase XerC